MEDADVAIDFIFVATGSLDVQLQSIEKLITATKNSKPGNSQAGIAKPTEPGLDNFRLKTEEYLD
jgi:hypothetical protein